MHSGARVLGCHWFFCVFRVLVCLLRAPQATSRCPTRCGFCRLRQTKAFQHLVCAPSACGHHKKMDAELHVPGEPNHPTAFMAGFLLPPLASVCMLSLGSGVAALHSGVGTWAIVLSAPALAWLAVILAEVWESTPVLQRSLCWLGSRVPRNEIMRGQFWPCAWNVVLLFVGGVVQRDWRACQPACTACVSVCLPRWFFPTPAPAQLRQGKVVWWC